MLSFIIAACIAMPPAKNRTPVAPPPRERVAHSKTDIHISTYDGEVLFVDSKSIAIRGHVHGVPPREKITRNFLIGDALSKGQQEPKEKSPSDYRLSDVKVGDRVLIILHPKGNDDVCVTVRIFRRPGGTVPRAPFEAINSSSPHHMMMNAYQDFEEKGVPLPLKYHPHIEVIGEAEDRAKILEMSRKDKLGLVAPPPRPLIRK